MYVFLADGLNNPKWRTGVQSIAGTTVRFSLDLTLPLFMKVLDSLVTKTMESEVAQPAKLKEVLEAS